MKQIPLFRFVRPDGGVTVSTTKPDAEFTELARLIADDGMMLTDGSSVTGCVDTDRPSDWREIPHSSTL